MDSAETTNFGLICKLIAANKSFMALAITSMLLCHTQYSICHLIFTVIDAVEVPLERPITWK